MIFLEMSVPVVRKNESLKKRLVRIDGKIYDFGTYNRSFLQVALDLKKLGIKNYYFMLEIKDPSLVKIDPYAADKNGHTTLTRDEIGRVLLECKQNPWYYLREISRIPDQGGQSIHYIANRGNIAQAWCILHAIDSWLCLPRQRGKTQSALAIQGWAYSFGTTNSKFIFFNKDGENSKLNLRRLRAQLELLPEYMQFDYFIDSDGTKIKQTKNATTLKHPVNLNEIAIKSKATSYDAALNLARGADAPILHFDEPEFTNHIKTIIENSYPTYERAASNAERNHAMHARIFTCTPGDLDTAAGKEGQMILDRTFKWDECFYDRGGDALKEAMRQQGKDCNGIVYIEYQYYQIGYSQEWLAEQSAKIANPIVVRREILLQRLHGSSLSPFNQEDITYITETEKKPIDEIWLGEYYRMDVYEPLDRRIPYIVGVDCSTGTGGDSNAISVIHPHTLRPVAELECNYIGETKFRLILEEFVLKYVPKAMVCIERNSVGSAVIDAILNSNSTFQNNLYFDKGRDLLNEKMREAEDMEAYLRTQSKLKTYYGVYTEGSSRETMFSILARRVAEKKDDFITHNIIRDLSRLIRKPSGKIEAGSGSIFYLAS